MKIDENEPLKCELCIMGTKLYQGGTGDKDFPLGKCVLIEVSAQYLPTSTCSRRDDAGRHVRDESCYACHCSGDCDEDCNPGINLCNDVCDICIGEQEEFTQDLLVSDPDLAPVKRGTCSCPNGNDYTVGMYIFIAKNF
jgi:hypothetical protein